MEASVFRAMVSHVFSETEKVTLSITSNSFEKMYQNTYAASHTAESDIVTMDGYHDPTERDNFIITGNLINELTIGNTTHTILAGFESIDTDNKNFRFNTY